MSDNNERGLLGTLGHWGWNLAALIGIATVVAVALTIAGIAAVFND